MSKFTKFFTYEELFPQEIISVNKISTLDKLIDSRIVKLIDEFRNIYGSMIINNYSLGGNLRYRGFRPFDCKEGAMYSQHKFGRAIDCNFRNISVDEVREDIRNMKFDFFKLITRVEEKDNINRLHFDVAYTGEDKIVFFKG